MAVRQGLKYTREVIQPSKFLSAVRSFKFSELEVTLANPDQLTPKPDVDRLEFGKYFTDHMLQISFHKALGGWQKPDIRPLQNLSIHPAAKVLHYAVELFEGMKAYRGIDGKVRLFRPDMNMARMNRSALRSGLPTFESQEMVKLLCRLIQIEQEWVPHADTASLYIRPTFIGVDPQLGVTAAESALLYAICCPVNSYFKGGVRGISLLADPKYTRAWPGGVGDRKMGANYGPTVQVQREAMEKGFEQVLWLYGQDDQITEAGTMNIFVVIKNENGDLELITPPLNGLILPGITRASILDLARECGKFKVIERDFTMNELIRLLSKRKVVELFGAGTACIVSPVSQILYNDQLLQIPTMQHENSSYQYFLNILTSIQYGRVQHPWAIAVDDYCTAEN